MRNLLLLLSSLLFINSCQESMQYSDESASMEMKEQFEAPQTAEAPPPPPPGLEEEKTTAAENIKNSIEKGSKIIKDGQISVKVANLKAGKAQIDSTLKKFKAYYENEFYQSSDYRSTYRLKIRVPSENFEKLLAAIEFGNGKITQKNINARDVTEEYVDIAIRLNSSKIYLNRYQELLKRANSIKDILEIQEKARYIEEEIDARTGRLKFIDDQVRFSTLSVELFQLTEQRRTAEERNFGHQIVDAFKSGFDGFLNFLVFIVNLWPFILLFLLLWGFRKRFNWRFWRK